VLYINTSGRIVGRDGEFSRPRRRRVEPPVDRVWRPRPMSRSLAEAISDLGDVDNTSAAERHIVRRACVLIVGWSAGPQVRPPARARHPPRRRSSVDTTLISMPASRCSRATWRRRPKAASSTPSATRCGRRSPSGTAASWTVDGGSTRRRRGRENSPSRPTIGGMTVVDRPTISEQFFGRFHAHGFPGRWEMPSIYIHFCASPGAPLDRRGLWVFFAKAEVEIASGLDPCAPSGTFLPCC
jgi:hypothetical protein